MKEFAIDTVIRYSDGTRVKVIEHKCDCKQCCFSRYTETRVMGVPNNKTYYCAFSIREETYCSGNVRKDGKDIVYKLLRR